MYFLLLVFVVLVFVYVLLLVFLTENCGIVTSCLLSTSLVCFHEVAMLLFM